ncbi:hypothetical protein ACFOU2_00090 [Bacillus songklensis]|uniref:Uncharacterized protein n=1 Tax=Bacillus songklensis TaxID=1069116 RepID=A0ABV8AWK9_9BACI
MNSPQTRHSNNSNRTPKAKELELKIYKAVNQKSTMDVKSLLTGDKVYKKSPDGSEYTYNGRLLITITEHGKTSARAYIEKKKIKPILYAIMNHTFHQRYGIGISMNTGFEDWGRSVKDGIERGRRLKIFFTEYQQYMFQIEEGPVETTIKGGNKFKHLERKVQKYLSRDESLEFAHEVYDYIQNEEIKGLLNGRPLYTVIPRYEE